LPLLVNGTNGGLNACANGLNPSAAALLTALAKAL